MSMQSVSTAGRAVSAVLALCAMFPLAAAAGKLLENADRQAEQAQPALFRPGAAFDTAAAASALQPGAGRLRGVLYHQLGGGCRRTRGLLAIRTRVGGDIQISLFPATPHLVDYVALLDEHRYKAPTTLRNPFGRPRPVKPKHLLYDARMLEYGLSAKTDEFGRFEFQRLRPGRYWLNADASVRCTYDQQVQTGSSEVSEGPFVTARVDHYTTEQRYWDEPLNYHAFVEVRDDGSLVELESELIPVPDIPGVELQPDAR